MKKNNNSKPRKGSMTLFLLIVLIAIMAMGSLAINKSFIDTAQTDLQTALDLSAKTGAIALGREQSTAKAKAEAEASFFSNRPVGGSNNVKLKLISTTFGNATKDAAGKLIFRENQAPTNAIKMIGQYPKVWAGGMLPFNLFGSSDPVLQTTSVATRSDNDICLVVDRSASMAWDLSNVEFSYPNGRSELANYFEPPDPAGSRWAALERSVIKFQSLIKTRIPGEIRMGLTSYSSDFTFGVFQSEKSTVNRKISDNLNDVISDLESIGKSPIIGDTDIEAGLSRVSECFDSLQARKKTGKRIVILFTDGLQTAGGNPGIVARRLKNTDHIVHVISFSQQANQTLAARVATAGGGIHVHADNENQLDDAFKTIAQSFPGTLID